MASVLPDPDTEFGARVVRRLREDVVAWLTVVDPGGTPQPAPVWFLWDEDTSSALIYSHAQARRLAHLRANPRAALHLDGDGRGGDVVVLTGEVHDEPTAPAPDAHPAYLDKYGRRIARGWGTAAHFAAVYSVALRLRVHRVRGH